MTERFTDPWVEYFMNIADAVSLKSKDEGTKVGALIVGPDHQIVSTGFNGFPRGVKHAVLEIPGMVDRFSRPGKYAFTAHAEANAIYQAARHGICTSGCHLFVNSMPPCCECAKAIIQAGIVMVYSAPPDKGHPTYDTWKDSYQVARIMLAEAGIRLFYATCRYNRVQSVEVEEAK